jgi:hypothetical protein
MLQRMKISFNLVDADLRTKHGSALLSEALEQEVRLLLMRHLKVLSCLLWLLK